MKCCSHEEVTRYLQAELAPDRAREVEQHLESCRSCAGVRQQIEQVAAGLRPQEGEFEAPTLASDVVTLIHLGQAETRRAQTAAPRPSRWLLWLSPAVAGAAAALVVLLVRPTGDDGFAARSTPQVVDDWVDIELFRAQASGYLPVAERIRPDDALAFAVTNQTPERYRYLMVFALDEGGAVFWYYPAHVDASQDPQSVEVCAGCSHTPLPDEIEHRLAPGKLRLFAVFTPHPLRVSDMEETATDALRKTGDLTALDRLELAGSAQSSRLLHVRREVRDAHLRGDG